MRPVNRQRRAESVKPWRNADPAGKAFPPPNNDEHPATGVRFAQIAVLPADRRWPSPPLSPTAYLDDLVDGIAAGPAGRTGISPGAFEGLPRV
jgi:hypothetical protein